jgi:hypothetical protein
MTRPGRSPRPATACPDYLGCWDYLGCREWALDPVRPPLHYSLGYPTSMRYDGPGLTARCLVARLGQGPAEDIRNRKGFGFVNVSELLLETFNRLPELVRSAAAGLTPQQLRWVPATGTNSVGWLVWHLTRIQDDHVADLLGEEQVWVKGGWPKHFGLDPDPSNTGYGHAPEEVAAVRPGNAQALIDYYQAVASRTHDMLRGLTEEDLDRIVDRNWDPPVTLGVRLVSIASDDLQHIGQAAYVRGLQSSK